MIETLNPDSLLPSHLLEWPQLAPHRDVVHNEEEAAALRKLLRGELSAVEAYDAALGHFLRNENDTKEGQQVEVIVQTVLKDHEDAVFTLQQMLRNEGVDPDEDSGLWGTVVQAVVSSATLFGEEGMIWALTRGEEHGLQLYEESLEKGAITQNREYIISKAIPKQKAHLSRLALLLS